MSQLNDINELHAKIMAYYHKKILDFFCGTNPTLSLAHMHFDNFDSPELILHDDNPVYIGRIEVDNEGVSNFVFDTPMNICCGEKCETLSMQDFISYGRLSSLSTIRQMDENVPDKCYYAYVEVDGEKSEKMEIFPLLRAGSTQASFRLRNQINILLHGEAKQVEISSDQDEYHWIEENAERFDAVCHRLSLVMFKTAEQILLTMDSNT